MYKADRLKKITKIKLVIMSLATILPIVLVSVLGPTEVKFFDAPGYLKILRYSVFFITEGVIIYKIVGYIRVLTSKEYFDNLLIKKKDERLIFIKQRYQSFSLKLILYLLVIAVIVSGFLNEVVFLTVLSTIGVLLITMGITFIYYDKKF